MPLGPMLEVVMVVEEVVLVEVVVVDGIEVDEEEEEVEVEEDVVLAVVVDDVVTDETALELVLLEVVDDVVEDVVEDVVLVPVPAVADVVVDRLSHGQSQLPDWHTLSAQKPGRCRTGRPTCRRTAGCRARCHKCRRCCRHYRRRSPPRNKCRLAVLPGSCVS